MAPTAQEQILYSRITDSFERSNKSYDYLNILKNDLSNGNLLLIGNDIELLESSIKGVTKYLELISQEYHDLIFNNEVIKNE